MAINVYLSFNGNCREVVEYYANVFGQDIPQMMTFGDTPPDPNFALPEEAKNLIMHTRLMINGSPVMFSDAFPGLPYQAGNNFSLAMVSANREEIESYFHKLKEGAQVRLELQETFWSKCYGSLIDKFGIEWQFNYEPGECGDQM